MRIDCLKLHVVMKGFQVIVLDYFAKVIKKSDMMKKINNFFEII